MSSVDLHSKIDPGSDLHCPPLSPGTRTARFEIKSQKPTDSVSEIGDPDTLDTKYDNAEGFVVDLPRVVVVPAQRNIVVTIREPPTFIIDGKTGKTILRPEYRSVSSRMFSNRTQMPKTRFPSNISSARRAKSASFSVPNPQLAIQPTRPNKQRFPVEDNLLSPTSLELGLQAVEQWNPPLLLTSSTAPRISRMSVSPQVGVVPTSISLPKETPLLPSESGLRLPSTGRFKIISFSSSRSSLTEDHTRHEKKPVDAASSAKTAASSRYHTPTVEDDISSIDIPHVYHTGD
ncbi:uncharacterized protein K452DRAFT_289071 [Aplosporella prunicola CBS 121167]|uniref:Uncharacterized protein n=1 Tax=Aplosporella prunicola CBS 121167 TaxID=1176127 RepID=A0A6A6BAN0_9PEZI|nr:uncharacterized protein K452DRAFT_289071 [Aplosporella prunicola CBS 121167]KAF2140325.1 hypothetical protein K452DRAFT_289071 [Aplosporella prunicola CBS 121167]